MKYSLMLTTVREFEDLEPLFHVSRPDAELIIIYSKFNERTAQKLAEVKHNYHQIVYAPKFLGDYAKDEYSTYVFKNDKMRCHNTGYTYCEGEWIFKLDDDTELCPNFFDILDDTIEKLQITYKNKNFVIRPVKLEAWRGHKKWVYPLLKDLGAKDEDRYFGLSREGFGYGFFVTLDQFIATRESVDLLNGMDERFDIGHGHDDVEMFQRYISLGYNIVLDRNLMTYQTGHQRRLDHIPFARWLYEVEQWEIINGRYKAYNPFELSKLRQDNLITKTQFIVKKKSNSKHTDINPFNKFFTETELADNHNKIIALKDKHKGESLFILGNSPDITKDFIDKIRNKITFAANGFLVMKDKWDYEPTYMVVTNQGTFDNHLRNMLPDFKEYEGGSVSDLFISAKKSEFIMSDLVLKPVLLNLPALRPQKRIDFLKKHIHIAVLNKSEFEDKYEILHETPNPEDICFDLSLGTYLVGTVITDLMLPLAVWMGFKNIYLKGCSGGAGHFYDTSPRHFWDEDKQKHMYQDVYAVFKKLLDEKGVNIFNLDKPTYEDYILESKTKTLFNPTALDGHFWDGPVKHQILGKPPYVIEYKNIEEII